MKLINLEIRIWIQKKMKKISNKKFMKSDQKNNSSKNKINRKKQKQYRNYSNNGIHQEIVL